MALISFIFWASLALVFWTYIGYYLFLRFALILGIGTNQTVIDQPNDPGRISELPAVSIVITAHNEETRILAKLENTLSLNYPSEKLEIIVVSDGSTDSTNEIVSSMKNRGIKLLALPVRSGKHYGQGKGIKMAENEIIVFTDATTWLEINAILKIVRNFADPKVGCVSGKDMVRNEGSFVSGEGAYVRYEMNLREMESRVCSLIGASGSFFSVRKELCDNWHPNISSDFYLPIQSYLRGYKTLLDSEAIGYYSVVSDSKREFGRKVRTIVHGIDVLFLFREVLNPFRHGFFAVEMISHKLIRWLVPFCLIALVMTNPYLPDSNPVYSIALFSQIILYTAALLCWIFPRMQKFAILKIPYFFLLTNLSILVAWYKFAIGERYITWESTKR